MGLRAARWLAGIYAILFAATALALAPLPPPELGKLTVYFLFTGDMESETEELLLRSGAPLRATILKVAHHGSSSSSQAIFLIRVAATAAGISCGAGNGYGHPDPSTVRRLLASGATVFRTDRLGDIRAVSDGTMVTIDAPRSALALGTFRDAENRLNATTQSPSALTSPARAACCKQCTTGQPCGDACIALDKRCHVGPGCACW